MAKIIPSLLVTTEDDFKYQIEAVQNAIEMVQIDLADGEFVPNITWPYQNPKQAQKYLDDIDFELHLMVSKPVEIVREWSNHPRLKRILVHYESTDDIKSVLEEIKGDGKQAGLVINPHTPVEEVKQYFNMANSVMVMGVNPGFQGQKFLPETLEKIKEIKEIDKNIFVEVDGGVNEKTIKEIVDAGADAVCPGSAVFKDKNIEKNISELNKLLTG